MFDKDKDLLVNELDIDEGDIALDTQLVNDLGINSLELADLVFSCEAKYHIEIDEEDYRKFVTVGDVIAYLEANQA